MALPAPTSPGPVGSPSDETRDVADKLAQSLVENQGKTAPESADALLFQVLAESAAAAPARLTTPTGRSVEVHSAGEEDRLTVRAASGVVELEVRFTERGPLLRFSGADVELQATKTLRLAAQNIEAHAQEGVTMTATQDVSLRGDAVNIQAERGNVKVEANDDVILLGERIRLNT